MKPKNMNLIIQTQKTMFTKSGNRSNRIWCRGYMYKKNKIGPQNDIETRRQFISQIKEFVQVIFF